MYPRHRLDGLADAIYGVAMTLLVLEIRLPEGFTPHTSADLVAALAGLAPKFWPYVLSFAVLGQRWRLTVRNRTAHESVGQAYVNWWLVHLLAVTFVPFASMLIGRYASLAPSIWVYSANLAALSISGWGLASTGPESERAAADDNRFGMVTLLIAAAAAVAVSFWDPPRAPLAYLIAALGRPLGRLHKSRKAPAKA
ncbi:MAG TPA: TMEM175 family protein [Phenylobacterium sp.]|nr:TMEM175 family protein [Phenylobacterium sp.]